jgi:hypothetical protein
VGPLLGGTIAAGTYLLLGEMRVPLELAVLLGL